PLGIGAWDYSDSRLLLAQTVSECLFHMLGSLIEKRINFDSELPKPTVPIGAVAVHRFFALSPQPPSNLYYRAIILMLVVSLCSLAAGCRARVKPTTDRSVLRVGHFPNLPH